MTSRILAIDNEFFHGALSSVRAKLNVFIDLFLKDFGVFMRLYILNKRRKAAGHDNIKPVEVKFIKNCAVRIYSRSIFNARGMEKSIARLGAEKIKVSMSCK